MLVAAFTPQCLLWPLFRPLFLQQPTFWTRLEMSQVDPEETLDRLVEQLIDGLRPAPLPP